MKKYLMVLFVFIMVISFAVTVFAADMPTATRAKTTTVQKTTVQKTTVQKTTMQKTSGVYPAGPIQKAERGFTNIAFGWTEIPKRIVDQTKASNPIKGLTIGLFQGSCRAFARTASGFFDVATFPFGFGGYGKPAILPDMPAAK
ncbi:MAG: exosortase system-associated protein, TIGR04073 family [Candidatus Tantalella remota]|nr:exosortase system-associated protein, TIGR04073 family [Candidatus Tantalella remota]